MVAFRRPQNLRNHLVRAKINTRRNFVPPSCGPCNRPRCQLCSLIPECTYIVSHTTGQKHRLYCTAGANCSSTNVIYCLTCDDCGIQYIGCTNNLRLRLNNHKSCIRLHKEHRSTDVFRLYQHYRVSAGHYFKCTILESRPDTDTLKHFESRWIYKLRTIFPSGLNILDNVP